MPPDIIFNDFDAAKRRRFSTFHIYDYFFFFSLMPALRRFATDATFRYARHTAGACHMLLLLLLTRCCFYAAFALPRHTYARATKHHARMRAFIWFTRYAL